jgi:methylthioribose-1-phosphate isomerase
MSELDRFDRVRAFEWRGDHLRVLDQRKLPFETLTLELRTLDQVFDAIVELKVRGAPAIGIVAAYGVVLAQTQGIAPTEAIAKLKASRPTAVNLFWALDRMARAVDLESEAQAIEREDHAANRVMAQSGSALLKPGSRVLTICNTGSLATAGLGTALGVIRAGFAGGRIDRVYACETRPWLQGARLTAWELLQDGIPTRLIADSAAAHLMREGHVDWVIAGADRICANGDSANKIGTYALAIAARFHGLKTMIVAPTSTVDPNTPNGRAIEIEQREGRELLEVGGVRTAAPGALTWNPVFDVTPVELIDAIVTERGVWQHGQAFNAWFGA